MIDFSALSAAEVGNLLGKSERRIRQLADAGAIPRRTDLKFDARAVVAALIRRAEDGKRSPEAEARARLLDEKSKSLAMQNAARLGDLIAIGDVAAMIDELCGVWATEISTLPVRVGGRDLALRARIDAELDRVRANIFSRAEQFVAKYENMGKSNG